MFLTLSFSKVCNLNCSAISSGEQFGWLRALSRRSKRSQSEVVRSLIEHGTVRERITRENLDIIRKLIGESKNLNQLARRANAYGFYRVADECSTAVQQISQLIKQLKDDIKIFSRNSFAHRTVFDE